jgi:hypothetical protein
MWGTTKGGTPALPIFLAPRTNTGSDKLVGNMPNIFAGDWSKSEEFIIQWELYEGINISNTLMCNPSISVCNIVSHIYPRFPCQQMGQINEFMVMTKNHKGGSPNGRWVALGEYTLVIQPTIF